MDAGNGEVERILDRLRRQRLCGDEPRGERNRRIRHVQEGKTFEHGEASLGGIWVARPCLGEYHLGDKEFVACSMLVPPRYSELLMGGHKQIPTRPCRKITDKARFDIDGGLCAPCV